MGWRSLCCGCVVDGDCWASMDGVRVEEVGGVGSCAGGL